MSLLKKIRRRIVRLRLQPIRVFCFHQVSELYNPLTMWECDWTQIDLFKQNILNLKEQYTFISLTEAHEKIKHDCFRNRKYAVLTADDGYKSLLNILPWLNEQKIPVTLFINSCYLDDKSWSAINEEQSRREKSNVDMLTEVCPDLYLTKEQLQQIASSPLVTLGLHGYEHFDATKQSLEEFAENVKRCRDSICDMEGYVPYMAYTWGRHNGSTDSILRKLNIVPVLVNGTDNYNNSDYIDRVAIDGKRL